jgi:A/G-specific adenine glycosylase
LFKINLFQLESEFRYLIISWYRENKRDLPWRRTKDPYRIWVSEVILQQTRVEQGRSYYERFIERFPDLQALAAAEQEDVMKTWQGLGYYQRAKNMHQAAISLISERQTEMPASYDELIKLKGIGDYSASAISSIAYGEAKPVVDGNVLRVMARYEGIREPVSSSTVRNKIREILATCIDPDEPGDFNQALMELGAMVCKPKNPQCEICPLKAHCYAFRHGITADLPTVTKAKALRTRYMHYLVIIGGPENDRHIWLKKRTAKDIWQNLYDFPLIETDKVFTTNEMQASQQWKGIFGEKETKLLTDPVSYRHILSHQELRVIVVQVLADLEEHENFIKTKISYLHKYPVPRLIEKYLKKVGW